MRCNTCKDTRLNDHDTYAYGQSSYDGDACSTCRWQGPCNSAQEHTRCQDCLNIHPDTGRVTPEMTKVAKSYLPDAWTMDLERAIAAVLEVQHKETVDETLAKQLDEKKTGMAEVLEALPLADGWVWCDAWDDVAINGLLAVRRAGHEAPYLHQKVCPGPHELISRIPKENSTP